MTADDLKTRAPFVVIAWNCDRKAWEAFGARNREYASRVAKVLKANRKLAATLRDVEIMTGAEYEKRRRKGAFDGR